MRLSGAGDAPPVGAAPMPPPPPALQNLCEFWKKSAEEHQLRFDVPLSQRREQGEFKLVGVALLDLEQRRS